MASMRQLEHIRDSRADYAQRLAHILSSSGRAELRHSAAIALLAYIKCKWSESRASQQDAGAIRVGCFQCLCREPSDAVARQLALCVAILARKDMGSRWPMALKCVADAVSQCGDDSLMWLRGSMALRCVCEQLAAKALARRAFVADLAPKFLSLCVQHMWKRAAPRALTWPRAHAVMLLCYDTLALLFRYGLESDAALAAPWRAALALLAEPLGEWLRVAGANSSDGNEANARAQILVKRTLRLYAGVVHAQPFGMVALLAPALQLCCRLLLAGRRRTGDSVALAALRFVVQVLDTPRYQVKRRAYADDERTRDAERAIRSAQLDAKPLVGSLIFEHMRLRADEMRELADEPERSVIDERDDHWQYDPRLCARHLLGMLLARYSDAVAPCVMQAVDLAMERQQPPRPRHLDACWSAVGVGFDALYDRIDFAQWLRAELLPRATLPRRGAPSSAIGAAALLRRRIAWLVAQWAGRMRAPQRAGAYRAMLTLMSDGSREAADGAPPNSLAVRLQAAMSMVELVDFDFEPADFASLLAPCMRALFGVIDATESSEAKRAVLETVSVLVARYGKRMSAHAAPLVQLLGALWARSARLGLLRQSILRVLSSLMRALSGGADSGAALCARIVPVVAFSVDVRQRDSLYLLGDGLALWHDTLRQVPSLSAELARLFDERLGAVVAHTLEYVELSMRIVEAYALVGGNAFVLASPPRLGALVKMLGHCVKRARVEALPSVLANVALLLQLDDGKAATPLLAPLVGHLPSLLLSSSPSSSASTRHAVFTVLARTLLHHPSAFARLFCCGESCVGALGRLLDVWLDAFDAMPSGSQLRKLSALALISLVTSTSEAIASRVPQIVDVVVSSLADVEVGAEGRRGYDFYAVECSSSSASSSSSPSQPVSAFYASKMRVHRVDPMHRHNLRQFAVAKLKQCNHTNRIDPSLLNQLCTYSFVSVANSKLEKRKKKRSSRIV
jgi:hypothetical protein